MLGTYIQEAVSLLQDYLSEDKLCIGAGLCDGKNNNDLQYKLGNCDVCESAILEIETHLKDPETKVICTLYILKDLIFWFPSVLCDKFVICSLCCNINEIECL